VQELEERQQEYKRETVIPTGSSDNFGVDKFGILDFNYKVYHSFNH
jgi:hypothetical protein